MRLLRYSPLRADHFFFTRCLFAAAVLFLQPAILPAADAETAADLWVLAASRFEATDIPEFFSGYADAVPLLVLQRLSGSFTRNIQVSESRARELQTWTNGLAALVKSRTELTLTRDKILFDTVSETTRAKRRKAADEKIRSKEEEISQYQKKPVSESKAGASDDDSAIEGEPKQVTLWESGAKLFDAGDVPLSQSLTTAKIQGLLTGTLEDAAGYLVVTLSLETGLPDSIPVTAQAAGSYEDLDLIIDTLASAVKTTFSFVEPVNLHFVVEPETASVFVDGGKLLPGKDSMTVPEGTHKIDASAPGYRSSSEEQVFSGSADYMITIALREEELHSVGFASTVTGSLVYLESSYFGETPLQMSIPSRISLGLSIAGGVPTWFYLDGTEPDSDYRIDSNRIKTKTLIERRRSVLYWSLGALYISLPFAMLTNGVAQDKLRSYDAGYLPNDTATQSNIEGWIMASNVTAGISIGLGVNYAVQLVRYLLAADRVLPQRAYPANKSNTRSGE